MLDIPYLFLEGQFSNLFNNLARGISSKYQIPRGLDIKISLSKALSGGYSPYLVSSPF
jgi:hypothetical protein